MQSSDLEGALIAAGNPEGPVPSGPMGSQEGGQAPPVFTGPVGSYTMMDISPVATWTTVASLPVATMPDAGVSQEEGVSPPS